MAQPNEAHEVQSVRKRVEGMGVENQQESGNSREKTTATADKTLLPSSWDAYADLHSPFACFAPRPNYSIFVQPSSSSDEPKEPTDSKESSADPPLARAFAPTSGPGNSAASNSLCPNKFPSGSDFFLKGKRNTPLADSSPDADPESTTQNKKLKLPPPFSSSSNTTSVSASSASSSSNHTQQGFANYAIGSSTSLQSKALDKLNNTPSLQTSSIQPTSTVSNFLKNNQPSSVASSACAVNGEPDDPTTPAPSSLSANTPAAPAQISASLGFSAFANSSGFQDSSKSTVPWSDRPSAPSVFDQEPQQPSSPPDQNESNTEKSEWGAAKSTQKKTHLALSAELSQEDKHEGFLATEVITGEENEDLIKSVRCKIFTLGEDGSWRERGTGGLRLLRTREKPYRFRMIMRADAVLRVLLNVPIFKGFSYRPTQEKFLTFASTVVESDDPDKTLNHNNNGSRQDSSLGRGGTADDVKTHFQQYLCRFGKPEARQEMIDSIEDCLHQLDGSSHSLNDPADHEHFDPSDLV